LDVAALARAQPASSSTSAARITLRHGIVGVLFVACRPYVPRLRGAKISVAIHRRVPPLADDCDFRELGDDCEIEHRNDRPVGSAVTRARAPRRRRACRR
jgi:hypothetical protein